MVGRCEINNGCVVVDLDNTLLNVNSLKELTKFLLVKLFKKKSVKDLADISKAIVLRKLRVYSHIKMKHIIVRKAQNMLSESDIESFTDLLLTKLNPQVLSILNKFQEKNCRILIATAAPDFYLPSFINKLPFGSIDFLATHYSTNLRDYIENRNQKKSENVKNYLSENNLKCVSVISDHYDDLPLFKSFEKTDNYLISPSSATLKIIRDNLIDVKIFKLRDNIYEIKKCR